jgi:hypothetical protein
LAMEVTAAQVVQELAVEAVETLVVVQILET